MRKKIVKKSLCLGLAAAMLVSVPGCSKGTKGSEIDTSVREFNILAGISPMSPNNSEKTLVKQLNEAMDVTINWECVNEDLLTERKNLIFGAGTNLPDALMGAALTDYELITNGGHGTLIALDQYINEETMPNLMKVLEKRPNLLASCTMPDGNVYSLPDIGEMSFIYEDGNAYTIGSIPQFVSINKQWLDNLNLEMPKTIDELHDVLVAFRDQDANGNGDPTDEIPLSFMNGHWCAGMGSLYSAFGFTNYADTFKGDNNLGDNYRAVEDGKVVFNAAREGYKEAMIYFHKWFEEGLIDLEVFSQDESQYIAKGNGADARLGVFTWWEKPEVVGVHASEYEYLPFLTDENGNWDVNLNEWATSAHGKFAVTKACKNPELLLKWVDQLYDPYNSMQAIYGPIGEFFAAEPDENGVYVTRELKAGETEGELKGKLELYGPYAQLAEDFGTIYYMEDRAQERLDDLKNFWFKYVKNTEYFPTVTFTLEETQIINEKMEDITSFVAEKTANWLKNGGVEEEWESYLAQLDKMGLQEVLAVWQAAYDRYQEAMK